MRALAVAVALGAGLLPVGPVPARAAPGAPAAPTAAIPGGTPEPPGPATVSDPIAGYTFVVGWASLNAPDHSLRIRAGDTVEWTNLDPVSHSVTFDAFPTTTLYLEEPGAKASHTFTEAGYYTYRCVEHPEFPGMEGLVFVSDR